MKKTKNEVATTKKTPPPLSVKIAHSFKDRSRKDIQTWRRALLYTQETKSPRFDVYFDLIDDLKTDGTLKTQVLLRKSATLSHGFQVRNLKSGEINEQATQTLSQKWFYEFLNVHLDSILYGTRIIEFLEFSGDNITFTTLPERNAVPTQKLIYLDLTKPSSAVDYSSENYRNWVVELGGENPLGIINDIVPNLIWKRNVAQSWAEFCEKFGMPLVSATTNNPNPDHVAQVEKQLLSLAEASVGVFPEGTSIKFDEANRTDAYNVYSKFIEQNSKEIAGVIVGSNTLSESANNRSQTEVHERSLDYKIAQADRREIAFTVNDILFPILQNHGYTYISDDDVFEWIESKEELDLEKYWTITQGLLQHYEVDPEWISQTFDIPILNERMRAREEDASLSSEKSEDETDQEAEDSEELEQDKKELKNNTFNQVLAWFKQTLNGVLNSKKKVQTVEIRLPNYETCCHNDTHFPQAKTDEFASKLDELTEQIAEKIHANQSTLSKEALLIVQETNAILNGLKTGVFGTQGVNQLANYDLKTHELYAMMEYNVFAFATSKTIARIENMKELVFDEKHAVRPFHEFLELAKKGMRSFNREWLRTEYNLAIATGQNALTYNRLVNDEATEYVQYQTVGDGNVRDEHRLLDGKIFHIKDREAMRVYPPNGYGCRCEMVAVTDDVSENDPRILKGTEPINILNANGKFNTSPFAVNRGDLKQVFTNPQWYTDKTIVDKQIKELNELTFLDYNRPLLNELKRHLNALKIDETINELNVSKLFQYTVENGKTQRFMALEDYAGRKIKLFKKDFDIHTKGNYLTEKENRHRLFPHIKDVLNKPDEVWANTFKVGKKTQFVQSRYIKCYADEVLVVDMRLDNKNGWNIKTWYKYAEQMPEENLRKGVLIQGKEPKKP